eukprot:TRINITY_DN8450_c0_g5_i2.p3 TRINITY_DN8450_c0_g5~~TRINITY_DN8450_c0_g5_i2.p3  ORF type:complete len:143 (+),score=37.14 TRINITY_DN8450_c0_g5_i2:79-507(+)
MCIRDRNNPATNNKVFFKGHEIETVNGEFGLEQKKSDVLEPVEASEETIIKIITQLDSKDEKADFISVKHLIEMAKDNKSCTTMLDNNCLNKLLKLLANSNANLALLASNLVIMLLQVKKGQKQFFEFKGLETVLPFIVLYS